MLTFAYYLLKVSLVCGLLYSYYLVALRNKKFHQYNRFYLLLTVLLSLIIPLIRIKFWQETAPHEMPAIKLMKIVAMRDAIAEESLRSAFGSWIVNNIFLVIFSLISVAFLSLLVAGIVRIFILIRSNPNKSWNNVNFIFCEAKGTPFSFFRYIFWNKNIDLQTQEGKLILQHELTHVHEKHSADKLFINAALIIGWLNPFFWIIRKELTMIHEFIADEKAISNGDVHTFSAMLLKTAYPQHSFATLENPFFHSPIKRRLIMFTTSKKPSYSYLRRLMILPLLSFVIVFFSFKTKGENSNSSSTNSTRRHSQIPLDKDLKRKIYTVIERFAEVEPCESCAKTGVNVLEISHRGNSTKVKTVFASDNQFDFGNNKLLITKLDEISDQLKVSFDIFVPIHFLSSEDKQPINITEPSPELIKAAQEKIKNLSKQKLAYDPVFIIFYSKNSDDETGTKIVKFNMKNSDTIEARFTGSEMEWKKYLEKNLDANVPVKDKAPKGDYTVKVQFIVTETGEVEDISPTQIPARCPSCALEAVRVIKTGPKWDPMSIDGKQVASKLTQFITFSVNEN